MNIQLVTYAKTFNLGNYSSERIGVEVALNEGEDAKQALDTARELVEEYHQSCNDYPMQSGVTMVADNQTIPNVQVEMPKQKSLIDDIESCTELKVLESYRLIAKAKPELQKAYNCKLQSLKK